MDFKIVINSQFLNLWASSSLQPVANKRLLSLVNDFEDHQWRLNKFYSFVWDNIAETALSHRERVALSGQPHSLLSAAAKNLRLTDSETDVGKGSELAEVVLYGLMKHVYKALPVVPKIFYKQNVQDNAKGADSVHIVLNKDGEFSIWLGEAKFYNSIEDARFPDVLTAINNMLATDKLKKENSIVTSVTDLDDIEIEPTLRQSIKAALSQTASIDDLKPILNVPILLLHECEITASATTLTSSYLDKIKAHHMERALSYFGKQIAKLGSIPGYASIQFHLILFPVPKKATLVDKFVAHVKQYKGIA